MVAFDFSSSKPATSGSAAALPSLFAASAGPSKSFASRGDVIKNAMLSVKTGSKIAKSARKQQRRLEEEEEEKNNGFKKRFNTKVEKILKAADKKKKTKAADDNKEEEEPQESGHKRGRNTEDEDERIPDSQNSLAFKRRKEAEEKKKKKEAAASKASIEEEKNTRTIFVGNVATTHTQKTLKKLFSKFGEIESVRFRSVAVEDIKVPKKGAVITGQLRTSRDSMNAYIVFKDPASIGEALKEMDGALSEGKHIRVDRVGSQAKTFNPRLSIFVGNLSFEAEDEALRSHFAETCPNINSVRVVRDKATNVGKGFAYISFDNVDGVSAALKLHDTPFMNRKLRVSRSFNTKSGEGKGQASAEQSYRLKRGGKKIVTGDESTSRPVLTPEEIKKRKKDKRKKERQTGTSARAQRRAAFNKK